jgi:hemolysin III
MTERSQTLGEEIANSVSHGVALMAALIAVPFLITTTGHLSTTHLIGTSVFAATLVALYLTSTLYHALPSGPTKQLFMKLDHCAIYLFIAGSYTPFALVALDDTWSWLLFGLVWAFAFFGVALKAFDRLSHPWISTGLYLVMGWLVLFAAIPLVERVPQLGITFLVAGGIAYTVGVVFFVLDSRVRYAHAVWHGFVMTGSGFHLFAVLNYSA